MSTELDDHLDPDAPGPTDDPEDALDQELREAFLAASMLQMDALTKALRQGRSPVRVLRLIETVASASRVGFSELRADDFDDDELEGDFAMDPVGYGQAAPRRRRRRRGNGMNVGVAGMAYGGGGLLHGPPDGPARHLMGQLEQMGDGMSMANRARTLRDLTGAIANAREMQDEDLERELRAELDQLRRPPGAPVITNAAPVLVTDNDAPQQPAERDAAQGG